MTLMTRRLTKPVVDWRESKALTADTSPTVADPTPSLGRPAHPHAPTARPPILSPVPQARAGAVSVGLEGPLHDSASATDIPNSTSVEIWGNAGNIGWGQASTASRGPGAVLRWRGQLLALRRWVT